MRLYEFEKGRAGEFATQNPNTFDFELEQLPTGLVDKTPKHGVLDLFQDNDPIPMAVQGWLNSLGYNIAQDGVFGRQTADAMNDAIEKSQW